MNETLGLSLPDGVAPTPDRADFRPVESRLDAFDEKLRTAVLQELEATNQCLARLQRSQENQIRKNECNQLHKTVQSLRRCAAESGMCAVARQATVLESLLKELCAKASQLSDSRVSNVALAVDVLATFIRAPDPRQEPLTNADAVIVDAERLSCSAASSALRNAGLQPHSFSDSGEALDYLRSNPADLVIFDAATAAKSGVDFSAQVRSFPLHQSTPIICVTGGDDAAAAAAGVLSSGGQFLAKPYNIISYLELTLKAVSLVMCFRAVNGPPRPATEIPSVTSEQNQSTVDLTIDPLALAPANAEKKDSPEATPQPEAGAPTDPASEILATLTEENRQLRQELAGAWQMCEELQRQIPVQKAVQEVPPEPGLAEKSKQEVEPSPSQVEESTDRRLQESAASCARAKAELERERGERRRVEQRATLMATQLKDLHGQLKDHFETESQNQKRMTELEQQLREREEALARASADVQKETEERQLAEQQLGASNDLSTQLHNCLTSFETAKQAFIRRQEEFDLRMQDFAKSTSENEARLQKETADRQRAEEALREAQAQSQQAALELSRLKVSLDVEQAERKHLEGDAAKARYASLDSARAGILLGNKIRRQMREPVEKLMQITRCLLGNPLEEEPKKLVESALENALLLQASLQDLGNVGMVADGSPKPQNNPAESGQTVENPGPNLAAA